VAMSISAYVGNETAARARSSTRRIPAASAMEAMWIVVGYTPMP
jgi:hypothetical protein